MGARLRRRYYFPTEVLFGALDNAPFELGPDFVSTTGTSAPTPRPSVSIPA
jgi:hypothetical protein